MIDFKSSAIFIKLTIAHIEEVWSYINMSFDRDGMYVCLDIEECVMIGILHVT